MGSGGTRHERAARRLRLRRLGIPFCAVLFSAGLARGAGQVTDLSLFRAEGWLRASVRARDLLDDRTRSTIQSGLPGTCIYQILVQDEAGRPVAEQYIELTLRYDLWENVYILEDVAGPHPFRTLASADSALSHRPDCGLASITSLQSSASYRVLVRVAVRPLAPEDRRRLSKYVSRTSGGGREEVAFDLSGVFKHILGEKERSRPVIEHIGPLFRIDAIKEAP